MSDGTRGSDRRLELVNVIHRVRDRWRMRLAMRGAVIVVAGTILALLLSASSLEALRFSSTAIISFRIAALAIFGALVYLALIRPLQRRVSDSQVALYLEECDPELQTAILSAVEASAIAADDSPTGPSPRLVEKLVDQAIARCEAATPGMGVETQRLKVHAYSLLGVVGAAALLVIFGPAYLRHGLTALVKVYTSAEAASPYHIDVMPGNAKVPKASDQTVTAKLSGFDASEAALMVSVAPGAPFERVPLLPGKEAGTFEGLIFHVEKSTQYYVESNKVRSSTFTMEVVDLPTVDKLVLEYTFPPYTGLEARTVDPGGDVAALQGTNVAVKITPTMQTKGGRLKLNDSETLPLTVQSDGTLAGNFTITKEGFYSVELDGPQGEKVKASPQYTIDVLADQEPAISFGKPGRDTTATPVEEVFAEVRADDDFGVKNVKLLYSVNGGAEKSVNLFGGAKTLPEVTASHTLYLEELGLKPGDFVSYYAQASDNDAVQGSKTTTSDIYFVQIRPFRKDYRAAQSAGGGGGGGGGGRGGQQDQVNQLSRQQQQIIAATFNIQRDQKKLKKNELEEKTTIVKLAQEKLRGQVEELSEKMNSRLDVVDPALKVIADALPKAVKEMQTAEGNLQKIQIKEALNPEGRALKLLQDAEMNYEVQVQMQRGGGGGGGGGGQNQMAEDLADLFELELDKLDNQYEMQQRAEQQTADRQVDELVDRLKELARRQQQEAERQRQLSAGRQSAGGGGGADNQRQLAQQLEEMARQLEQLQRDEPKQNLGDAISQMRNAANAMRQAAANGSKDGGAQAQQALDALKRAQQRLEQGQGGRIDRDLADAKKQADQLVAEQKQLTSDVNALDGAGAQRQQRLDSLVQRKEQQSQKVADLQKNIDRMANQSRRDQRDTARKLDEASGQITDRRIRETIDYTRRVLPGGNTALARSYERPITEALEGVAKTLGEAQAALGRQSQQDAKERAAQQASDLRRRGESIQERMNEANRQNQQGRGGQQGQQGQDGQQARNGQQGQQGQQGRGQQGQQGQGQQGQQGRGQGQQGQGQQGQQGQGQQGQQGQGQQGQQGQGGQQGQQGQGGQQNAQGNQGGRGGNQNGDLNGGNYNGGYGGNLGPWRGGTWGRFTDDQVRQFSRELQAWNGDLRDLERRLLEAGVNPQEIRDLQNALRPLSDDRIFADPNNLSALMAAANEKAKQLEFLLQKKAEGNDQPLALSGSDEIPAGFKQNIEEYFRALAKKQ